jgi:hypothetical protein
VSILETGSPCPYFEKKAVFIYTTGRQPCSFWRKAVNVLWMQAVHVYILKKRQSLSILEAGSHVHSGGRQSMFMFLKKRQSLSIQEAVSHVHFSGW